MLRGEPAPYSREELASAARDFEAAYEAYAEHQRHLERYWCLRWIAQEGLEGAEATVVREELVRLEGIPLVCRATGLPPGERPVYFGAAGHRATPVLDFAVLPTNTRVDGPLIVESAFTTIVVDPGARCRRTACGSLVIEPEAEG